MCAVNWMQEAFEQFGVLLGLGAEVEGSPAAERMAQHWGKYWGVSICSLKAKLFATTFQLAEPHCDLDQCPRQCYPTW